MKRTLLLTGWSLIIVASLGVLLNAAPATACSVCYGDPDSSMTLGAQAGVLVLLGVVGTVLTGLVALLVFWMRRAAQLQQLENASEGAS